MRAEKYLRKYLPLLVEPALLVLSFWTALYAAPFFKLSYTNPHNISNPYNIDPPGGIFFNPENNFWGLILVIVGTLVIFFCLRWLYASKFRWAIKILVILLLLGNFFLLDSLPSPGFPAGPVGFDNFHNGEQLGVTHDFLKGKDLYSQTFYLRGAGVDVLIPALGFKLLGQSIGSFILITDFSFLLGIGSFLVLLAFLIRNPLYYALAAILFYVSDAVSFVYVRDVPVWLTLGLLLLLFKQGLTRRQRSITLFSIGLLSSLALYIAIDRGVLLFGTALLMAIGLLFVEPDDNNVFKFNPKNWRRQYVLPLWMLGGIMTGFIIPGILLGWQGFKQFFDMTFLQIPNFGGLLVSTPFPSLNSQENLIWGPVFVAIASAYLLFYIYKTSWKTELNKLLPYTIIFLYGVLCIKTGSNRIHLSKMAMSIAPLFLAAVLILALAIVVAYRNRKSRQLLVIPIILGTLVLVVFAQLNFARVLRQPDYTRSQLRDYKNLSHAPDDVILSPETVKVKHYIMNHTSKDDKIFAFTSDPMYYYAADRENPTRFYISWFADPQPYTDELLRDLKKDKPAIIIYEEKTWMDNIDNVTMQERLPEVDRWIKDNYKTKTTVGKTTLLTP